MNISNQKPVVLSPVYQSKISGAFDPVETLKSVVATPLFQPLVAGQPVTMSANGAPITEDIITQTVLDCCGNQVNPTAEASAKTIFGQCLVRYNEHTHISVREAFVVQSGTTANLPEPNDQTVYNPSIDVIPVSRQFLAGQCDYDTFFATLGYYARPETLGFYFANETAFDTFKTWMSSQMSMLGNVLPPDTNQIAANFQTLTLTELTESLVLRHQDTDNNDPYSFARLIIHLLMTYTTQVSSAEFGVLPFSIPELICPKSIVFVNVEKHARATARAVAEEWKMINSSIQMKPRMISNTKLTRLTAAARNLQKIQHNAINAANSGGTRIAKAMNVRFRKTVPTTMDLAKIIRKVINKMEFVNKSMNTYKFVKTTFAKPNRRNPDDFNKQGKILATQYKPDIHLYIDTSGSISERNYQDAVKACIMMAKKLNINLYFNSFSDVLSQTTKLNTKDKSLKEIYKEFQRIPKVTGGTDYEQIWHFINRSKKRRREISLLMTDFEYYAPNHFVKHPKNLYYIPCSHMDWDRLTRYAESFCKSMENIDPNIRTHLLF